MIEANAGDLLDNAWVCSNKVYCTLVIDPLATTQTIAKHLDDSAREAGDECCCPVCEGSVVSNVRAKCPGDTTLSRAMWCPACWLIYKTIEIGTLDKHGNYHPYEE